MRSGFKPLYLPVRRKGTSPSSPSSVHRTLWVDGRSHGWTRRNKSHLGHQPNLGRANYWRTNAIIYSGNSSSCKCPVIVVEREMDGHKFPLQKPVYYVSTVLTPCKLRYPHYQKITYAVFMASQKLRHCFQECLIMVASEVPLNDIINNRDAIG